MPPIPHSAQAGQVGWHSFLLPASLDLTPPETRGALLAQARQARERAQHLLVQAALDHLARAWQSTLERGAPVQQLGLTVHDPDHVHLRFTFDLELLGERVVLGTGSPPSDLHLLDQLERLALADGHDDLLLGLARDLDQINLVDAPTRWELWWRLRDAHADIVAPQARRRTDRLELTAEGLRRARS